MITSYEFAAAKAEDVPGRQSDLVVFDEAHRLRNVNRRDGSKRAKALRDATRPFFKLLLTATPLQNSLLELYWPISVIDELAGIRAPVLPIYRRYDRMVPFEVSIAILNHIADSRLVLLNNCGQWPPFEKPAEWAAQVLAFLRGY